LVKTYCFDIDGTICTNTDGDYKNAKPYFQRIKEINSLYSEGNKILYFTARGSTTNIDWSETTTHQLDSWGAKYHKLILGKPFADYYIDDKSSDPFLWFT
jgi:hypothetical protein